MTVLGLEAGSFRRPTAVELGEHLSASVAIGSLAVVLASDAGRDTAVMVWVLLACLPALLLTRPWRYLPTSVLLLLAVLPTAAIAVCYLTPTQFAYSRDLCIWPYAAVLATIVASYARTPQRRVGILLLVCVLGFYDIVHGFAAWRYHRDPARAMVGTFYQQDMFGAFCAAVALAAAVLAVFAPSPWRWIGWVVAPTCAVGCILSTSRAGEGVLLLGTLVVGTMAAIGPRRWMRLASWAGILALSVGLLFVVTGPLFFPGHGGSPLRGTTQRSGSDSLASSSTIRQAYWKAALREFGDAPVAGEGFGAFGLTFFDRAPVGAFGSRYAHNGFLQGLAEGGVLFGLPLLVLGATVGVTGVRALAQPRRRDGPFATAGAAAGLGALALLGHTLVDFDWSFPMMAGLLAVLAALAGPSGEKSRSVTARAVAPVVLLGVATVFSAYAVHQGLATNTRIRSAQATAAAGRPADAAATLVRADNELLPNPLLWAAVLSLPSDPVDGSSSRRLETALRRTAGMGRLDPHLELTRAAVLVRLGRTAEALSLGDRVLARSGGTRPDLIGQYGELLASAGQRDRAVELISAAVAQRARPGFPLPDNVWRLVGSLQTVAGTDSNAAACAFAEAEAAFGPGSRPLVISVPSAACRT